MIKYAVDSRGNLCCADDPNAPQYVRCPLCGAEELRKVSPLGNPYYALFPGAVHRYEACRTLDGSVDILDLLSTKIGHFQKHLWGVRTPNPGGPDGPNEPIDPGTSDTPDDPNDPGELTDPGEPIGPSGPDDPEDVSMLFGPELPPRTNTEQAKGMRTLPHMAATGLLDCNDRQMEGGWQLSDLVINPNYAYMLLDMQNVGKRVLQGRPQRYIDRSQIIRFKINIDLNRYDRRVKKFLIADIHIPDEALYKRIRNMLFEQYLDEAGNKKVRWKYDRVAIAGKWERIPRGMCQCGWRCNSGEWSCIGQLRSDILKSAGIYPFPDSRLEYEEHSNIPIKRERK